MPLVQELFSPPKRGVASRYRALIMALLTTGIGTSAAIGYWASQDKQSAQYLRMAIHVETQRASALLHQQFHSYELIARSVKGFFESSEDVSVQEYRNFVASLDLQDIVPDLRGVGFARYVTGDRARERAEQDLHFYREGDRRYFVHPRGPRSEFAPIVYMEPQAGNESAVGFDVLSSAASRSALQTARESGDLVGTDRLALKLDPKAAPAYAVVFYLPVYRSAADGLAPSERSATLVGWVTLPFRLADVFRRIDRSMAKGLQLQVFEGDGAARSPIMVFEDSRFLENGAAIATPLGVTDKLVFGRRAWTYRIEPTPAFVGAYSRQPYSWITAIALMLSISLGYIVYLLLTSRDRAHELATRMTAVMREKTLDLNDTLDAIPDLLFEMDCEARYLGLRTSSKVGLNMPVEKLLHRSVWDVLNPDAAAVVKQAIDEAAATGRSMGRRLAIDIEGGTRHFELSVAKKAVAPGAAWRFIVLSRDITDRIQAESRALELAYFDALSGLPTRACFLADAPAHLLASQTRSQIAAVLLLDLDSFKVVNGQGGHRYGDSILREIAKRIRSALADGNNIVARFGGDEFVVLITDQGKSCEAVRRSAEAICTRLLASISAPLSVEGRECYVAASIGVAFTGYGDSSLDALISGADFAMYEAKRSGGDSYCFFDGQLQRQAAERIELEHDMKSGLGAGAFNLVYQPQVDERGTVFGVEALCRWDHPRKGAIAPGVFIELAERSGYITTLGRWVMLKACETLVDWNGDPVMRGIRMAINVSARQFNHPDFVQQVQAIVTSTGVNPALLELELTESVLAHDVDAVIPKMTILRGMGLRFSLDDFGTGYSSLNYLKRLPLDQLKLDRCFVRDMLGDNSGASITRTIIGLGQSLGLDVIAEGVETTQQRDFLLSHGCRHFQGYLFSRPVSPDAVRSQIQSRANRLA